MVRISKYLDAHFDKKKSVSLIEWLTNEIRD